MPAADGLGVLIVERSGEVRSAPRRSAGRANSALVADLAHPLAGAHLVSDGTAAILMEAGMPSRLLRLDLSTGAHEVLADGLSDPAAFVIDSAATRAIVLARPPAG